jgi:hypothetical protein
MKNEKALELQDAELLMKALNLHTKVKLNQIHEIHTFQETTFLFLQKLFVFELEALLPASSIKMQFS